MASRQKHMERSHRNRTDKIVFNSFVRNASKKQDMQKSKKNSLVNKIKKTGEKVKKVFRPQDKK
jgi:hypothetical protein